MQQLLGDWVSHSQTQSAVFPQQMCSPRSEERYQAHQWTWPLGPCPLLPQGEGNLIILILCLKRIMQPCAFCEVKPKPWRLTIHRNEPQEPGFQVDRDQAWQDVAKSPSWCHHSWNGIEAFTSIQRIPSGWIRSYKRMRSKFSRVATTNISIFR